MSKLCRAILFFFPALGLLLSCGVRLQAQSFETSIKIQRNRALVEGKFLDANAAARAKNFSFLNSHVGAENLGARLTDVVLFGQTGEKLEYKKLIDGEFLAPDVYRAWSYTADLSPPQNLAAFAHVSSISGERGILMLGDLLPQFGENVPARIKLELPADWRAATIEKSAGANVYEIDKVETAVFVIGKNWRAREFQNGGAKVNLLISGQWKFSDEEAFQMTRAIFAEYEKLFGENSFGNAQVFLGRFPEEAKFGRWEAETRGASVTIFSADMPFSTQSVQKLHEQLRHEIFHLWIPNGVHLTGNYDWFYEGFALYQSLRTAVAINRIRFEDFLDTLGRAYDIDSMMTQRTSLIEASKNRWSGANTIVYARGMLVGFLMDVALLRESKAKRSLSEILREVYQKHRFPNAKQDGNAALLKIFGARPELRPIVEKYVRGAKNIDWQTDLETVGIETKTENFSTKLTVKTKLGGRQKDLLNELGYNNWRNRSQDLK